MKRILWILLVCLLSMTANAQEQFISDSRFEEADRFGNLNKAGGVLVLSQHSDLVITVTNAKSPKITPKGKGVTGYYEYEVVVDRNETPTPKIQVNRRGDVRRTSFVVVTGADLFKAYLIEEVAKKIGQESVQSATDAVLDAALSEVELTSAIEDLKVECVPALKANITRKRQSTDHNINIISVKIPVAVFVEADAKIKSIQEAFDALNAKLIENNKDGKYAGTDEEWERHTTLEEELEKAKNERESMNVLQIYANGTNRLALDISGLGPRVKLCYGIVPLEKEVHVSKCNGFLAEGGRLYGLRKYDEARKAFQQAMDADDAPYDMIPAIKSSIEECDSCLLYERYAMGSLVKMKQMREKGEGSQAEVVKYASGALEFLNKLYRYNPIDFYGSRIETLNKLIEEMPLSIKFTVVKWVKTYSGFEEKECLGNVEVWANYGGTAPALNSYKNDRRLRELLSNSIQYQKLGVTDMNGELELNLVRKSLPKGFFFRPVGYNNDVKIGYMDVTEIMNQSEGDYNKRQFRMKMYTEE